MRRGFQLHMATCVAMSFVCGALIWLNVDPSKHVISTGGLFLSHHVYGWPLISYDANSWLDDPRVFWGAAKVGPWHYSALLIDIPINLGILCLATFLFEYWMRKRGRIVPIQL